MDCQDNSRLLGWWPAWFLSRPPQRTSPGRRLCWSAKSSIFSLLKLTIAHKCTSSNFYWWKNLWLKMVRKHLGETQKAVVSYQPPKTTGGKNHNHNPKTIKQELSSSINLSIIMNQLIRTDRVSTEVLLHATAVVVASTKAAPTSQQAACCHKTTSFTTSLSCTLWHDCMFREN